MTAFKRIASIAFAGTALVALVACGTSPTSLNTDPNAGGYPSTSYPNSQYPANQYPTTQYPTTQYPANQYPANQYPQSNVQSPYTEYGRVTNIQVLQSQEQGRTTGAGAIIGGIAGGVIGNQIGGGSGRDVARIAGIAGGAIAGNAIEKNNRTQVVETYRISVQTDNGSLRAYDLSSLNDLRTGDRVRIENGQIFRF